MAVPCDMCGKPTRNGQKNCSRACRLAAWHTEMPTRFWARVDKRGPDECWPWLGHLNQHGYGMCAGRGLIADNAHRWAWRLARGEIPAGLWVLHRCDNRVCVNPDHLWLGTAKDNTQDMLAKGRNRPPIGERAGNTKLTAEDIVSIRTAVSAGEKQLTIARRVGISRSAVSGIARRRRWRSVP